MERNGHDDRDMVAKSGLARQMSLARSTRNNNDKSIDRGEGLMMILLSSGITTHSYGVSQFSIISCTSPELCSFDHFWTFDRPEFP